MIVEKTELHVYSIAITTQDMEQEINQLEMHMSGLSPTSPEFEYDAIHLSIEEIELETRKENPNLDPLSFDGNNTLEALEKSNPVLKHLRDLELEFGHEYPSECTKWGIPMDWQNAKFYQIA
jgi:hypothetical protein